jgi:hypothetical protein
MAKNSKKRKTDPAAKLAPISKKVKYDTTTSNDTETLISTNQGVIGGVLYEDELETTTDTLLLLAQNPSLISLKALKPFKTAVHDYWRVAHETTGTGGLSRFHVHLLLTLFSYFREAIPSHRGYPRPSLITATPMRLSFFPKC